MAKKKVTNTKLASTPTPRRSTPTTELPPRSLRSSTLINSIPTVDTNTVFEGTVAERAKCRRQSMPAQVNTSRTLAPAHPAKKRKIEELDLENLKVDTVAVKQKIVQQKSKASLSESAQLLRQKLRDTMKGPSAPAATGKHKAKYLQPVSKAMHKKWDEKWKMYAPEPNSVTLTSTVPAPWRRLQFENFAKSVIDDLQQRIPHHPACYGLEIMERVLLLLLKAKPASDDEGPWLSSDAARAAVEAGTFHYGPMFLENQQSAPLMSVKQFLEESVTSRGNVHRQDPSKPDGESATSEVSSLDMRKRFSNPRKSEPVHPWNCLELACPYEDGTRPPFLNSKECRLLSKLKHPNAGRQNADTKHNEPEKWALLAEAGALTAPHQDSHGYETYLTVNEGTVGFGWLLRPTEAQRRRWVSDPFQFTQGEWRYVVLLPGQTVYFPSGTIHFVFRHPAAGHTLIFGGHVLRFSLAHRWFKSIMQERINASITNEELTESVQGYASTMAAFVCSDEEEISGAWNDGSIGPLLYHLRDEVV